MKCAKGKTLSRVDARGKTALILDKKGEWTKLTARSKLLPHTYEHVLRLPVNLRHATLLLGIYQLLARFHLFVKTVHHI